MKTLKLLLFLIPIIPLIGNAQDVGLPSMIYPIPNQQVHLQYTYDIEFVLKNYGPTAVPANAGMNFILLYDGILQSNASLNSHPKINPGDSLPISINNQSFSTPNATIEVTVVVDYPADKSNSNDTITNIVRFSVDNNVDLGPSFIHIIVPDVDSVIAPGETIYLMRTEISNFGTVTIPRDYTVKVESKMYNQTKGPFSSQTETALDTGGYFLANIPGQQPTIQQNNGPFQICAKIVDNADDKNSGNDEYCQVFYAYDWTGIYENDEEEISSFASNGQLQIDHLSSKSSVIQIYDIKGELVFNKQAPPDSPKGIINISNLKTGVYILKVMQENQVIHSNKFAIDW